MSDIKGTFYVPSYQRGYRWGADEVLRLLNDIYTNGKKNYCLQPVVVRNNGESYELIKGVTRTRPFSMEALEQIVQSDEKQRYLFDDTKTLIRANQGHSIPVDVELPEVILPEILYHGTGEKFVASIKQKGLLPMSRLYIYLSADVDTAIKVGRRHGKPVVFEVLSQKMALRFIVL